MFMIKYQKVILLSLVLILTFSSFANSLPFIKENDKKINATIYFFKSDGLITHEEEINYEDGSKLIDLLQNSEDYSSNIKTIINQINNLDCSSNNFSDEELYSLLTPPDYYKSLTHQKENVLSSSGTSFFCSIISGGSGKITPIVLLPRPRIFLSWEGYEDNDLAITTVGGLISNKGFIAQGSQNGLALGFIGLGITYGTPFGNVYGFTGYSFYSRVSADDIEFYPPNSKPVISDPEPSDYQQNIPITLSDLSFQIHDDDNDLMSYSVSTSPDIGSGTGNNKRSGVYSIPISGLQSSTTYSWTISVSDGMDTSENTYSFTTEYLAPVITMPNPIGKYISHETSNLQFTITDYQGDLMDYIVETSPYIGSKMADDVGDGTYNVPIDGLDKNMEYTWYLNVTDGTYWTREKFVFSTDEAELVAYWNFNEGSGTVFSDSSGNGNHGTISGGSFVDGISGTALSLDGIDDYADATDFDIDDDFAVSFWIKPESTRNKQCFIGKHTNSGKNILLLGYYGDDDEHGYSVYIRDDQHREGDLTTEWQHIVVTGRKISNYQTNVFLYKNSEMFWEHNVNDIIGNMLGKVWTIGQDWDDNKRTDYYNGIIDEIKIFNGILTDEEIQQLYLQELS